MAGNQFDEVTIQGTTYKIPKAAANPPWGEELNDYLKALGTTLGGIINPADIAETTSVIVNNQAVQTNVIGLSFDNASVRASFVDYVIYRTTATGTKKEAGRLIMLYDATASVGYKWSFTRESCSDAGVDFFMSDAGQMLYTSDSMTGVSYVGRITFKASALLQS